MTELVHVKGLRALNAFLQQVPASVEQNVLAGGLRAAGKVFADEAKRLLAANGSVISGKLRNSVRVTVRRRRGRVTARIRAQGEKNEAIWVEYGTKAHFIAVRKDARGTNRRGRPISIRTINRWVASGSLQIGGNFVGASVSHPGAKAKPYMRPALDTKAREAIVAAAHYMRKRLSQKHGLTQAADVEID